uniref:Uncharacterized protein n=1 Tax=Anguilla anguilla TaxID=7936 RepID=A0A0E9W9Z5_ANGAN
MKSGELVYMRLPLIVAFVSGLLSTFTGRNTSLHSGTANERWKLPRLFLLPGGSDATASPQVTKKGC